MGTPEISGGVAPVEVTESAPPVEVEVGPFADDGSELASVEFGTTLRASSTGLQNPRKVSSKFFRLPRREFYISPLWTSPRSMSPRSISPLSVRRYGSDLDVPQGSRLREINRVVQMMHNQAMQDVGAGTSLGSMTALVSEMQLRMGRDRTLSSGHMSMRELCILVFPANSVEFELALGSFSDNDLLFKLHLNRRVWDRAFPKLVRHQFHHLLDVAGSSAEQLEADRREFNLFPCDAFTSLNDTFNFIADGRASFSVMDLRRVFVNQGIAASSQEVEMVWRRFQPLPFHTGVRFSDFLRQLRPRFMA